jgi:hypothetical protein
VLYNPTGSDDTGEWVEIYNPTHQPVELADWQLGDAGSGGEFGSGLYKFPAGATLAAHGVVVVARQATAVEEFRPDFEFLTDTPQDDPLVPNMVPAGSWDGFGFALGNLGDEVLLLNPTGTPVDVLVYGKGHFPGTIAHPGLSTSGHSLERRPASHDTDDCSVDFFDQFPPTPGKVDR